MFGGVGANPTSPNEEIKMKPNSFCPQCGGTGKIPFENSLYAPTTGWDIPIADISCQYCEGKGVVSLMTHHVIVAEGYPDDLELFENTFKHKTYMIRNPVDKKNMRVTPALREIRFYDVVIQKEAEAELLRDLGVQDMKGRYKSSIFKLWYFLLNLVKPMGLIPPAKPAGARVVKKKPKGCKGTEGLENLHIDYNPKAIIPRIKVFPLVKRLDKVHKSGYEEV